MSTVESDFENSHRFYTPQECSSYDWNQNNRPPWMSSNYYQSLENSEPQKQCLTGKTYLFLALNVFYVDMKSEIFILVQIGSITFHNTLMTFMTKIKFGRKVLRYKLLLVLLITLISNLLFSITFELFKIFV